MNRIVTTKQEQKTQPSHQEQPERQMSEGAPGCLLRLYWMMLGNALLAVCAYSIGKADGALTLADLVYWLAVASLIGARYADVHVLEGRTADGQPATTRHWKRYSLGLIGISAILWLAVHGLR